MLPPMQKNSLLINEDRPALMMQASDVRPNTAAPSGANKMKFSDFTLNDVSLLTTADKVIKKCEKEIEMQLKSKFKIDFSFRNSTNKM